VDLCVCQCVCARAPHKRVCAISLSLSLALSLCIHRGIDNHKVRGKEHGPQAAASGNSTLVTLVVKLVDY
jgi:hypothetical protein